MSDRDDINALRRSFEQLQEWREKIVGLTTELRAKHEALAEVVSDHVSKYDGKVAQLHALMESHNALGVIVERIERDVSDRGRQVHGRMDEIVEKSEERMRTLEKIVKGDPETGEPGLTEKVRGLSASGAIAVGVVTLVATWIGQSMFEVIIPMLMKSHGIH